MTTRELADRIVAMCRERKFVEVVKAHYAEDVVSRDNCQEPRVGFEAVLADNQRWGDDNGSSHVRAAMLGPSLTVPFREGALLLGTWQQIVLIELDTRPRTRQFIVQVLG
ncbi:MAG: YjbQ family protein [Candidatus Marinimicrobia bacterium]|nr:YjbQ family protein [Candidatus Neomarinimicrobiota bacterium]